MAETSGRLPALHAAVERLLRDAFPHAEPVEAHGMTGWQVRLRDPPPEETWRGTMDRMHLQVFVKQGRSGLTLHLWHPGRPDLLRDHEAALAAAGWKVMVGCLRWTRRGEPPLEPLHALFTAARDVT